MRSPEMRPAASERRAASKARWALASTGASTSTGAGEIGGLLCPGAIVGGGIGLLLTQAIITQIECSERLERLHRRVCRPLDKPLLGGSGEDGADGADASTGAVGDEAIGPAEDQLAGGVVVDLTGDGVELEA